MSLSKCLPNSNMYPFITHTWNPIKGECKHKCSYCYVQHSRAKKYYQGEPYLSGKELKTNLDNANFIFVGSMTDMWGDWIPDNWLRWILRKCRKEYQNKYLFQSKNPFRFKKFLYLFPLTCILGTTIESNRIYSKISKAPDVFKRHLAIILAKKYVHTTMISIEPILDFDVKEFTDWIEMAQPQFVVIGADSKGHNLPEPPQEKIQVLIDELRKFTKVILKDNLKRLGDFK